MYSRGLRVARARARATVTSTSTQSPTFGPLLRFQHYHHRTAILSPLVSSPAQHRAFSLSQSSHQSVPNLNSTEHQSTPPKAAPAPASPRRKLDTPENPSYPSFSLEGLGANRSVKIVLIVCLTVLGTMESIFWARAIWEWMKGTGEEAGAGHEEEGK